MSAGLLHRTATRVLIGTIFSKCWFSCWAAGAASAHRSKTARMRVSFDILSRWENLFDLLRDFIRYCCLWSALLISGQNSRNTFQPNPAESALVPLSKACDVLALLAGYHSLEMK